ncbi:MAG TPA: hypothetical protein VFZ53_28155 [Polyangiaceae bacterium]
MHALLYRCFTGLALCALVACSASAEMAGEGSDDAGGGTSGGGGTSATVAFAETDLLTLEPNEKHDLKVVVTPIEPPRTVRFALLDGAGSVADGSLDRTEATTNALGEAVVEVTAPSIPTTFDVRAMVGTFQTTRNVQVRANGTAELVIEPSYAGGRPVTRWVAEVYDDGVTTCADLEGNPPVGDEPSHSVTVDAGEPIVIEDVVVGKPLAVTLRAEHFAGGCSGVDGVVEGQPNSVTVTVTNRPVQLDQSEVTLRLGLRDQEEALSNGMQSVVAAARDAILGDALSDAEALLDAMEEEATDAALCTGNRFANARESNAWDDELALALGAAAGSSIRDDLGGWLEAGVPALAQDDAFVGALRAVPDMTGHAELTLDSVAGFDARDAGFAARAECTWMADAHDNVVFGATLGFNPAALLLLAAEEPALTDEPDAESLEQALALHGGRCDTVTLTLTTNGQGVDQSCLPCDVDCTRLLCERGLARLVSRASDALVDGAELRLAATGVAEVGDQAELRTLVGTWVGDLDAADMPAEVSGEMEAEGDY